MLPPGGADEIFFDGVRYVSARDAAREFDFDRDYIARLSRTGKVRGRQVGRKWYADHASLREFLVQQNYNKARRFAALAEERRQERARHTGVKVATGSAEGTLGRVQNIVRTPRDDAASPHRIAIARLSTTRGMHTFVDALRATSQRGSLPHPADIFSNAHLPAHAITPAMEFLHKFVALTLAFMLTFGTYAIADPQTARFAAESLNTSAHRVLDSYRSFTHGGVTVLADQAQAQLAAAAENPGATFASISSAFGNGVTSLARAFNTRVNTLVYSIAFPGSLTRSGASVDATVVPRPRPIAAVAPPASPSTATARTPSSQTIINNPVVERVIETQRIIAEGGLTEEILNRKLNELDNKLSSKVYALTSVSSPPSSGGFTNTIALTNRIDQLRGTSISNSTITGSTFEGSNVTTETLSVTKGATVGGDLTVSGTIVPASASSTNILFTNATGTNATSTNLFAGLATFTMAIADTLTATIETITNLTATDLVAINATTTNATSTNLYVSSNLSAITASTSNVTWINATGTNATTTNSFATTASSTNLFSRLFQTGNATTTGKLYAGTFGIGTSSPSATFGLVGDEYLTGGLGIGIATTAAGVLQTSGNAWIGGNLQVVGNSVTIGASSANTLSVNSSITSDLVPEQNVTRNLGSPSFYWNNAYIGTLNANNIAAASSTISGTSNASFTINSANISADTSDSNLIFFRGTVVPNGLLTWNSAANKKRFEFNQPLYINNASASTTNPTLTLQGVAGQTANILQIASSSGATLFSIAADGSLNIPNLLLTGSTTLQNFTFANATGTSATTTNFFAAVASSTNLFSQSASVGTFTATGNTTLGNATTTNIAATTATTSNLIASNSFTFSNVSGFLRAVAGAVSTALINLASDVTGVLPVASGGTGWAAIAAGAVPYGNGAGALATTTAGVNGQVLALLAGVPTWTATTTFSSGLAYSGGNVTNSGVLSLTQNGGGSAQTGALTLATSSQTTNGLTTGLNITNSGGAFTFAPTLSGTLTAGGGGSGISNPSAAGILVGTYGGGAWQQIATSSLGLLTTNVAEGTNLYYTDARVNAYIHASTTIPKTYTDNTFTGANTFNGALTFGSLNGPLDARAGVVGATTSILAIYGGTGQTSVATGDILYGSATNAWSRLGASTNGFVLALSGGIPAWVATSSINNGVTSITQNGGGSAQTGAITFATSSATSFNGLTLSHTITNSGTTFTFTAPTLSGTLGVGGGGTGLTAAADGALLFGGVGGGSANLTTLATTSGAGRFLTLDYSTGRPSWVATTSLGVALGDTTGTLAANRGGTGKSSYTAGDILYANSASTLLAVASSTDGFVLSLANGAPSWVATTTLSTISGTLGVGKGGTGITSVADGSLLFGGVGVSTANLTALATTSGAGRFLSLDYSTGRPSWVATTSLGVALGDTTGTLAANRGGTGKSSYTPGDILYANSASTLLAVASSTDGFVLSLANGAPSWVATTTLSTITGTLAATKGGTGQSTVTSGDILYGGTNSWSKLAASTNGFVLTLSGGVPAWVATTTLSNISGTLGVGSGGTGLTSVADGSLLFGGTGGGSANLTALATTSGAGRFLTLDYSTGRPSWVATSSLNVAFTNLIGNATVAQGGTGITSYTAGDILYANSASTLARVASSTNGFVLSLANGAPSWVATTTLSTITGTLAETKGGTNQTTYATGDILYASNSNTLSKLTASTNGFTLALSGGVPAWVATTTLSTITGTLSVAKGGTNSASFAANSIITSDSAGTTLIATGTQLTVGNLLATSTTGISNFLGNVGVSSSTPWAQFAINPIAGQASNQFVIGSSTATNFIVTNAGRIGIGTTSPATTFGLVGSEYLTGGFGVGLLNTSAGTIKTSGAVTIGTDAQASTIGALVVTGLNGAYTSVTDGTRTSLFGADSSGEGMVGSYTNNNFAIRTNNLDRMVFDTSGNVGIGVSPAKTLDIVGNDGAQNGNMKTRNSGATAGLYWTFGPDTANDFVLLNNAGAGVYVAPGASSWSAFSDARLKTNIQPLSSQSGLDAITRLNPVSFNWINPAQGTTTQYGFLAQEVQEILPELVTRSAFTSSATPDGALGVNYSGLVVPLVQAMQELNLKVESIASSTPSAENHSFVDAFFHSLFARVKQWLADAENGITDFFARKGHFADELCVGDTCVTPDQFKAMVASANQSGSLGGGSPSPSSESAGSTSSPHATSSPAQTGAVESTASTSAPTSDATSTQPSSTSSDNTAITSIPQISDAPSIVPDNSDATTTEPAAY